MTLTDAVRALRQAASRLLDSHGAHGPCDGNDCADCRKAYELAARAIDGFDILGPSALAAHEAAQPWTREFTNGVSDDDLRKIVGGAYCFVEPSTAGQTMLRMAEQLLALRSRPLPTTPSEVALPDLDNVSVVIMDNSGANHVGLLTEGSIKQLLAIYTAMAKAAPVVDRRRVCAVCRSEFERTP